MKIIAINSSFRTNGNTEHLIKLIEQHLNVMAANKNIALEFEHISLSKLNIAPCSGRCNFGKSDLC